MRRTRSPSTRRASSLPNGKFPPGDDGRDGRDRSRGRHASSSSCPSRKGPRRGPRWRSKGAVGDRPGRRAEARRGRLADGPLCPTPPELVLARDRRAGGQERAAARPGVRAPPLVPHPGRASPRAAEGRSFVPGVPAEQSQHHGVCQRHSCAASTRTRSPALQFDVSKPRSQARALNEV